LNYDESLSLKGDTHAAAWHDVFFQLAFFGSDLKLMPRIYDGHLVYSGLNNIDCHGRSYCKSALVLRKARSYTGGMTPWKKYYSPLL
jgi:hypothetical protein